MFKRFSTYALALTAAFVLSAQVHTAEAAKEKFERTKPHTNITQGTSSSAGQAEIDFVETGGDDNNPVLDKCEDGSREPTQTAGAAPSDCDPDDNTPRAGSGSGTKYSGNKEAGY